MPWRQTNLVCTGGYNGTVLGALERIITLAVQGKPNPALQPAPTPTKERIVYLANECMYHPSADSSATNPYPQANHEKDVCDALQYAEQGAWAACIGELEHLGNTGDVAAAEGASAVLADYMAREHIPWERIREMIASHLPTPGGTRPPSGPQAKSQGQGEGKGKGK